MGLTEITFAGVTIIAVLVILAVCAIVAVPVIYFMAKQGRRPKGQ